MSTRCTIRFADQYGEDAIIYRHSDGYPDSDVGVLADLQRFFSDVEEQTADTRFEDPSYLAAKFVVWQAAVNAQLTPTANQWGRTKEEAKTPQPLKFLGVGVVREDPGDIEYRYTVHSDQRDDAGRPVVTWEEV